MASYLFVSPLLHPLTVYVCQVTISALILGFTFPSSLVRFAALPAHVVCVTLLILNSLNSTGRIFWASYFAGGGISCLLHYIETALLSHWSFETNNTSLCSRGFSTTIKTTKDSGSPKAPILARETVWKRTRFGFRAVFSYRNVGTSQEVKNVPLFSAKDSQYVPSRGQFLIYRMTLFWVCYTILDLVTSGPQQPDINAMSFAASKVPFFGRLGAISMEDLVVRIATTAGLWVSIYCVLQAGSSLYSFIFVAFKIDEPKDWRPAFGSLREAYSLRRFWGMFWHQFQRQKLTGPANFLVFDLLRLQPGTLIARYTQLLTVFAISGLHHALIDVAEGYSWQSSGSIQFFMMQAVGIILEDTVQAISSKQLHHDHGKLAGSVPAKWARYLGYIWVAVFLVWSTPVWIYPALRVNNGEDKDILLPYSFIGLLKA